MKPLALLLIVGVLTACGGADTTAPAFTLTGTWAGTSATFGDRFTLSLAQNHAIVSGLGSMTGSANIPVSLSIDGAYADNALSFTMTDVARKFQPFHFASTSIGTTTFSGTINGGGFQNETITFTKQ